MIFVIDDDYLMAECVARAIRKVGQEARIFSNAIEAMAGMDQGLPEMIFLDILLTGPDGFTFLNELVSYTDTAKIPVAVVTSLNFAKMDLTEYGVVKILHKEKMKPSEIGELVERYVSGATDGR